jgi:opacity protein-like surface antigen
MMKKLTLAALLLLSALPLAAQQWSFGVGAGPFAFGNFVERRLRPTSGGTSGGSTKLFLTAATKPGVSVDLERKLTHRFAVRFEGAFTRAPLATEVSGGGSEPTEIEGGDLDVATFMVPLVFRINRAGAFRFHLLAGPALAAYRAQTPSNVDGATAAFDGTKTEWGIAAGGGVGWWLSDRFAIEANITDTMTSSPFDRDQFPDVPGIDIPRPQNVHSTLGLRWTF